LRKEQSKQKALRAAKVPRSKGPIINEQSILSKVPSPDLFVKMGWQTFLKNMYKDIA